MKWRPWRPYLRRLFNLRISTKITLMYGLAMAVVLVISSVITGLGVYFSFYHQAEVEIMMSVQNVLEKMDEEGWRVFADPQDSPVVPGVVLRIMDMSGQIIYQTDERYPSLQLIESHEIEDPPFWANKEMRVSEFGSFAVYHAKMVVSYQNQPYEFHFFRTITAEKRFLATLDKLLFIATVLSCLLALLTGGLLSSRILRPIRDMARTAQEIEVQELERRLEVPEARDELSELALAFNRMLDRLEAGFEQQKRFVSDASHELRTPVTVVLGYADMLARWGHEDKDILKEGIESIRSEAENMQQLIEKLLFLARADQKRQILHMEIVDFQALLADVMRKMQLVEQKHTVELKANVPALVTADEVTLRQMLRIFLENSVKYTPEGGHITAESKLAEGGKILEVVLKDDGIGIPKDQQAKVFERFYRVDSSRTKGKSGASGTGLGLAIASWIAEQHGIRIELAGDLGQGTEVHLYIPLAKTE